MPDLIPVSEITFTPAPASLRAQGLLGWVSVTLGELRLDGIAVRRTRDGRVVVTFPGRRDGRGHRHAVVRPTTDSTRRAIEAQVIAELRRRRALP